MNNRGVKQAFVIAEILKSCHFDTVENLSASVEGMEREVVAWPETTIDAFIRDRDPKRLENYQRATWRLDRVDLDKCVVWWPGGMGQRGDWAQGKLIEIANNFTLKEPKQSPVWDMKKFAKQFSLQLPLIVFVVGGSTFAIDDGCHRAVAMALAGVMSSSAWIGFT